MELCRSLTIDRRLCDNDTLTYHLLVLLLFFKFWNYGLCSYEGDDSLSVSLCTNDIYLIAHFQCRAALWNDEFCATKDARANEITLQEVVNLKYCSACKILILHDEVHEIRLCRSV